MEMGRICERILIVLIFMVQIIESIDIVKI